MDEAATKKVAKWSALITSGNSNCLIIKLIGQWWVYTLNKFQRFGFSKTLILSFSKDALKLFKVTNLYLFYIWRAALKKYYPFKKKKKMLYMHTLPSLRKQWTCCRHHEDETVKQRKACCHFFYWNKISYIWHINRCYFHNKKCDHLQHANHHDLQWPMKKCDFLQQI